MPLPLSSIAIEEKNKLANADSVFLVALKIIIPGVTEPVRVVANNEDITWRGKTWIAFPFEINEITEANGERPRVEVQVANANREMELYLHEYDFYTKTNGYTPIQCFIYVLNTLNLASSAPEAEHEFILLQPKSNSRWVTFVLGASAPWNLRYPLHRMVSSCRWRFKSAQCGYAGTASKCDKTLARCRQLNNSDRWGGFYGQRT
jgi:phage-related protein